jgi:hypothetical protein
MSVTSDIEPGIEWLRRQGYRVVTTASGCWYNAAPHIYQAFPYHPAIVPAEEELRQVLGQGRAAALRYSTTVQSAVGKISYHAVYAKPVYGLEQVSRQTRQNIRKGLEYATYEPVSFRRLADEGWLLRAETIARQGRPKAETRSWWRTLCLSAEGLPGFEAWGAFREGRLVAALIAYLARDCFQLLYQQSRTDHLKYGVNNTLGFVVTQQMVARGVPEIFYGLESLDASPNVDEFKFRMGYEAVPVRQRVVFHPVLRPAITPAALAALDLFGRSGRRHPRWQKASGLLRFYLEGRLPLALQHCPECLIPRSAEWLETKS